MTTLAHELVASIEDIDELVETLEEVSIDQEHNWSLRLTTWQLEDGSIITIDKYSTIQVFEDKLTMENY